MSFPVGMGIMVTTGMWKYFASVFEMALYVAFQIFLSSKQKGIITVYKASMPLKFIWLSKII